MKSPLISVIVPVYKVEKYLRDCINSIINQTYTNWELILVNDGSPDGSPQICDEYAASDKRIKVVHKNNGGLSEARNFGIKASAGSYIVFLDSDDYWNDNSFLEGLANIIIENPGVHIINFGWTKFYPDKKRFIEDSRQFDVCFQQRTSTSTVITKMIKHDIFVASAWNKCIHSGFLIENNLFFRKGIKSEDMEWCGNLLVHMPIMLCYNNKSYIYLQRKDSITATVDPNHIRDIIEQIKNALIKAENLPTDRRQLYLSFFAVQYLTLLLNVYRMPLSIHRHLATETENLKNILSYDINKKVKVANQVKKTIGYKLMVKALHFYFTSKKR